MAGFAQSRTLSPSPATTVAFSPKSLHRSDFETARSPARGRVSRRIGGEDGDKRERHWPPDRPFGSVVSLPTEGRDQGWGYPPRATSSRQPPLGRRHPGHYRGLFRSNRSTGAICPSRVAPKRRKGAGRAAAAPSSPSPLRGGIKGGGPATGAVPAARPPPPAGPRPLPWPFPLKSLHRSDLTLTGRSKAPQGGGDACLTPASTRYSLFAIRHFPIADCPTYPRPRHPRLSSPIRVPKRDHDEWLGRGDRVG